MSFFQKLKSKLEKFQLAKKRQKKRRPEKEWFKPEGKLTVDVYKTDGGIVIEAPLAGVRAQDLQISIKDDEVMIKGFREKTKPGQKRDYFTQECYWGKFSRKIILPEETDPSRAKAQIQKGILTIEVPKIHREKERVIKIEER